MFKVFYIWQSDVQLLAEEFNYLALVLMQNPNL